MYTYKLANIEIKHNKPTIKHDSLIAFLQITNQTYHIFFILYHYFIGVVIFWFAYIFIEWLFAVASGLVLCSVIFP